MADRNPRPWVAVVGIACGCVAVVALTLAWTVGPFAGAFDPARLASLAARLRDWPPAPFAIVVIFVVGNFVAVPLTLLIAATVLLFGPARGAACAYAAMLVSGSVIYAIGRFAARSTVERWLAARDDPRLTRFHRRVKRHGFLTVALLRLTPIPFVLQNLVMGAARIGYADFLFGTALGIVPAILLAAGLATQLEAWIASPDPTHAAWLIAAVVVVFGVGWTVRRWLARRP